MANRRPSAVDRQRVPVRPLPAGEQSQTAAAATSSASMKRPIGIAARTSSISFGLRGRKTSAMRVLTGPGHTALMRMPAFA